jgi:hypothetical protein
MESGRWPRRSTSALAATAVLRPLDADEVRHKIALLAGGSRPSPPSASCIFLHSRRARVSRYRSLIVGQNGAGFAPIRRRCEELANAFVQPLITRYIVRIEA